LLGVCNAREQEREKSRRDPHQKDSIVAGADAEAMQFTASIGTGYEFHVRVAPAGMVNEPAVFNAAVAPKRQAMVAVVLSLSMARSVRDEAAARNWVELVVIVAAETVPVEAEGAGNTEPMVFAPAGIELGIALTRAFWSCVC
jgi:hypothetical protein